MRIVVLSDIHSNRIALDAVLEAAGAVDAVWQLGDVVGYGPDPNGVVSRLRDVGAIGVRGNHDAATLGLLDIDWFNGDARRAILWTRERIEPATRAWLAALPEVATEPPFAMVHGSLRDPMWEYLTDPEPAMASLELLAVAGARVGLFGHTHLPSEFRSRDGRATGRRTVGGEAIELDDRPTLLNPGSVGQPRDGIPDASFLILDTEAETAMWSRVPYDIEAVQSAIRGAGLPERLAARLAYGL
jgi:predicted phosphodiesterase